MINNQKLFENTEKLYNEYKNTEKHPNSEYGCKEIFAGFNVIIPNGKYVIHIVKIDWEHDRADKKLYDLGFRIGYHLAIFKKSETEKRPDYPKPILTIVISKEKDNYTNSFDCGNEKTRFKVKKWFSLIMQMFFIFDKSYFN